MQVKDQVQALCDEGLIRVEKIGSGNWYWTFGSDERRGREEMLARLRTEEGNVAENVARLKEEVEGRGATEGGQENEDEKVVLRARMEELEMELAGLSRELAGYEDVDAGVVEGWRLEAKEEMQRAERWTENCWILEGWLREIGVDREALEGLRRECYQGEYVEGEGLAEW